MSNFGKVRDVRTVLMNKARNSFPDEIIELNELSMRQASSGCSSGGAEMVHN